MDRKVVDLSIEGRVATVTLARPETSNRIDARVLRGLQDACELIAASDSVALVVLEAEGGNFCAGWDASLRDDLLSAPALDPFGCIADLPVPVLAASQGSVISAGLELVLACDLRIAADNASFGLPEVSEGILPLAGGSQRLPRIAGRSVATSMLLLGDELDASAAYRAGLVSRVVPVAALKSETRELAQRIVANGPLALRYAKEAVANGLEMPLDHALRYELDLSVILQTTADRAEGVRAFLDKRPPRFNGT
jgi:enoyl-CoA hydratase/carnithine racemase